MRKFVLFVLIVIGIIYWATDFVKTGKLQKFIDDNSGENWAPTAQFYLGNIYQTASKYEKAEFCFNHLVEKYPKSKYKVDSLYLIGIIYEDTKRFGQARDMYKKILEEYPDYPDIYRVKTKYEMLLNY
ncbi:MAG: tetratricopeptide repeat protein [Elusimicrobia bacterium]|nr:tetratricopeptide repeat protein [Elusimicrobiota bacterium]